ncbi:redoxin [Gregarina niphandrodes]|uniref:Redoxin n=1 Tax=Gregarina niphandrodes TaxID=110365 RepID=A0A023BDM1_GRENI|nr:redoxin [Gregarina niphandrodes]EZG88176.1 redoxin [Gregarina niphandrodes]|eukprot:XP_011128600.1 redoxin [Gregarina niphandrodes]
MISTGDGFPNILLSLRGEDINLYDRLLGGYGIIVGCSGAFDGLCDDLLELYRMLSLIFKSHVNLVGCIVVNDPFVLKGWARKHNIKNDIIFISDSNGTLTKLLGLQVSNEIQRLYGNGIAGHVSPSTSVVTQEDTGVYNDGIVRRCKNFIALLNPSGIIQELFIENYSEEPYLAISKRLNIPLQANHLTQIRLRLQHIHDKTIFTHYRPSDYKSPMRPLTANNIPDKPGHRSNAPISAHTTSAHTTSAHTTSAHTTSADPISAIQSEIRTPRNNGPARDYGSPRKIARDQSGQPRSQERSVVSEDQPCPSRLKNGKEASDHKNTGTHVQTSKNEKYYNEPRPVRDHVQEPHESDTRIREPKTEHETEQENEHPLPPVERRRRSSVLYTPPGSFHSTDETRDETRERTEAGRTDADADFRHRKISGHGDPDRRDPHRRDPDRRDPDHRDPDHRDPDRRDLDFRNTETRDTVSRDPETREPGSGCPGSGDTDGLAPRRLRPSEAEGTSSGRRSCQGVSHLVPGGEGSVEGELRPGATVYERLPTTRQSESAPPASTEVERTGERGEGERGVSEDQSTARDSQDDLQSDMSDDLSDEDVDLGRPKQSHADGLVVRPSSQPCQFPFVRLRGRVVRDVARPSVRFDYEMSQDVFEYQLVLDPDWNVFKIYAKDLGVLCLDVDRVTLFDRATGVRLQHIDTPRPSPDFEFDVEFVVIDPHRTFPIAYPKSSPGSPVSSGSPNSKASSKASSSDHGPSSVGTLCIIHKQVPISPASAEESSENPPRRVVFCIPLVAGGRDNFLANVHSYLEKRSIRPRQSNTVHHRTDERGVNLQKYTSPYMHLLRYDAPAYYTPTSRPNDIWIVSEEVCYVEESHLRGILDHTAPTPAATAESVQELAFRIAAE